MKKSLAVICILACMFGLVACGSQTEIVENPLCTEEEAASIGVQTVDNIDMIVRSGMIDQYVDNEVSYNGLISWQNALEDMGEYTEVKDVKSEIGSDQVVIDVTAGGTIRDAIVEIIVDSDGMLKSMTTTVQYSFGEMMSKAALNTLIGMGTVFVVLILISLIISCFKFIPKIQDAFSGKKKEETKTVATEAVDNTIAQIIKKEDNSELIAVIAAAIAASEGNANTDGYVVRSIRRR
ncbi:MAG: OadG family protein [Lachnospiraceae bacterium]|nr:OadG family protein [Lachnospiraceae bacterium]